MTLRGRIALLGAVCAFALAPAAASAGAVPVGAEHPNTGYGVPRSANSKHRDAVSLPARPISGRSAISKTAAATSTNPGPAPFLTRPYWGWHSLNSWFDHCNPDYSIDGKICTVDGTVALKSNGYDPSFNKGYAVTPRGSDYIYYDGHNGYDLGLWYEELLAAAPGTVTVAGTDPVPYNSCFGNTVVIDHGNGISTRYAHMSEVDVSVGQTVYRGERIGVSGNSGCTTGPHLHFGVYIDSPWTAIDAWGWLGAAGADPYPYDQGDLWLTGNPMDPVPDAPQNVTAIASGANIVVSWAAPDWDGGGLSGYTVTASPSGATVTTDAAHTSATFTGLAAGTSYTFTVTGSTQAGSGPASTPTAPVSPQPWTYSAYFSWYDLASPGMSADDIHITNPGSTPSTGFIEIGTLAQPFTVLPGTDSHYSFPFGTIGGPVTLGVASGPPVIATQRVLYYDTFSEIPAQTSASAGTHLSLAWYDLRTSGFAVDKVHVVNPGPAVAPITIGIPGCPDQTASLNAGQEGVYQCLGGYGGPVTVTSAGNPVLASQRVLYGQTFNEVWAKDASAASTQLYFNWYDNHSQGFAVDNVHIVNPGPGTANVTLSVPGCTQTATLGAGKETFLACPGDIGGPAVVSSDNPVLASQRVLFQSSFNEISAVASTAAGTALYLTWFDHVSPGFVLDNVHVINPTAASASVNVAIPGCPVQSVTVAAGGKAVFTCTTGFGGPVVITATAGKVIASQRVEHDQSFNEVQAAA